MRQLELISEMCDIINTLSDIVKRQQTEIERSKVEEQVKEELREIVFDAEKKIGANEYHLRHAIDTDEPYEEGEADDN